MTAGANGVGLCFIHGASLPDPKGILLGSGRQTRFIRVESADVLSRPEVEALIGAAVSRARTGLSRQRAREAHHPIGVGEAAAAPQAAKMIG
jgi:hypothetical protein